MGKKDEGILLVVSGPSGAGKGTICNEIRNIYPELNYSISMTTRTARVGEEEGVSYFFRSKEEFERLIKEDAFLEYACVYGNYYGTLKKTVEENLEKGLNVILEIDVQGALIAKDKKKDAVLVFFKTKDTKILEERLRGRKTDSEEVIKKRLENALKELEFENKYDYTVINEDIEDSCQKLIEIINE